MHESQFGNAPRRFALDRRSLAVFRIGLGLVLMADAALRTRDFPLMFAADGLFPPALIRDYYDGDPAQWSLALSWNDTRWAAAILALQGIAGACLVAGWRTTTATVLAWIAQVSVYRRTIPAANAGDVLLSCLVFWSCFLPLGAIWSRDARHAADVQRPIGRWVYGPATVGLVLQVMAVYVGAGLSKWNASWFGGEAVRYALSIHDHGTPLGMWLANADWLVAAMTWGVLAMEIVAPLGFIAWPAARPAIVVAFLLFHIMIWLTMSVGLFAPIGMVAWLPLLPGSLWGARGPRLTDTVDRDCRSAAARWACVAAIMLAAVSFVHNQTPWRARPLPAPLRQAIHATSLTQDWGMFGNVPPQEQWAYGRGALANGRVVDVLRGGRPLEAERPSGGFTSLPHHRWHKLLWILPRPKMRPFGPSVAAALAHQWNARHGADEQLITLEIRYAMRNLTDPNAQLLETLVGAWPDRDVGGTGSLDRFLEEHREDRPPP